ncbi:Hsp20/alpha crystallin family protein [Aureispira anguillae]|uniref:Hsp20/alpha crystallin family protein n=1 Tax=Aureispira anguillae TaxID=2864201 RepID=A0A916DV43_9BACT|nr:Hsp20/alpha crystallin family protein [Aureispira anguillae]BDS13150.1 Hsp20/alpha crystallin family protein [Aureispira anguillae]
MRLVTRNFNRPTTTSFPSLWNEFFADDFFTKRAAREAKACRAVANNRYHNVPAVNIKDRAEHYFIEVAAPGFNKSDFTVELDQGTLTISAKKEEKKEDKNEGEGYTHKEFVSSEFKRTFTIPENTVNVDKIEASYEAGVLVVSIPKKEVEETKLSIDVL